MEEIKGSKTESYFQCGLTVKEIPEIDGCIGCMFANPTCDCNCDNEIMGLSGCNGRKVIYVIENMEAVEYA